MRVRNKTQVMVIANAHNFIPVQSQPGFEPGSISFEIPRPLAHHLQHVEIRFVVARFQSEILLDKPGENANQTLPQRGFSPRASISRITSSCSSGVRLYRPWRTSRHFNLSTPSR